MKNPLSWLGGLLVGAVGVAYGAAGESPAPTPTPRLALLNAMIQRPTAPWPRGQGHVLLAVPGTPEELKAYHEPGGSFSPAFGSFGVSLWVTDEAGRLVTTSDTIPLTVVTQRFVWSSAPRWPKREDLPAIETRTPYYQTTWSVVETGQAKLHVRGYGTNRLWVVVRGPGPAGAPLRSLHWLDSRLYVNDRWTLKFSGDIADVEVVPPGPDSLADPKPVDVSWPGERDWGYARFKLIRFQESWLTIDDALIPPPNPLKSAEARAWLKLELPDPRFAECLDAQVAHLMMGLVENQTRPGDPNNYPLNWLRDGAYAIVALARTGHLPIARELCQPFAEQDFFGGFGAEADAPGLALWALNEVSARLRDKEFDQWLWPHVQRKASLIMRMAQTSEPLRQPYAGPIVPAYTNRADLDLVCDPAKDGLIVGRMDWHRPLLFVNAVSYRGLRDAAAFADRVGGTELGEVWQAQADTLQVAWAKAFATEGRDDDRTAICGLHPSWVVADRAAYREALRQRRQESHDADDQLRQRPSWTYFTIAEAHQWLLLGDPAKAWRDFEWFLARQSSPGLYTWWEGNGEENTFHRWEQVWGWVAPFAVTPHYWTAAEMILMQLDMLAYLDESGSEPRLIIGAGVPQQWLSESLRVRDLSTRLGEVDWQWNRGKLTVKLHGFSVHVEAGPTFPPGTVLNVKD